MKKIPIWMSCLLLAALVCLPASARATSLYSMVFLGERVERGDARSIALGGSSQLLPDTLAAMSTNTALLARLNRTTVSALQVVAFDRGSSGTYEERDISASFPGIMLAMPIRHFFTLSIGYKGRYDPDGSFAVPGTSSAGDTYRTQFTKSGGLWSVPIGLSFNLTRFLEIGGTISLERGFIQERWDIIFDESGFAPSAGFKKEEFDAQSYSLSGILNLGSRIMIGGIWDSKIDYDTFIQERYTQATLDTSYKSVVKLPARLTVQATARITRRILIAASASVSDFSKFEGLEFPTQRLDREEAFAVGLEYGRLFRVPWRFGFSYEKLPYQHPGIASAEPADVRRILFSIGSGVNIFGGRGKLDLAVQFGRQGSRDDNGIQDRMIRFYIGANGSEAWRRKGTTPF